MARCRHTQILALLALVLAPTPVAGGAAAASRTPAPAGWYDGTRVSGETGDEDGLRLKLRYVSGAPVITFWWCEGECLARTTHDLVIVGDQISFVADDVIVEPGGNRRTRPRRFKGEFKAGLLLLGSPGFWKTETLKFHPADKRDD